MIVDASAVVTSLSRPHLSRVLRGGELAAPDLLVPETLNAFWKVARTGAQTPDRAEIFAALDRIRMIPSRALAARAAEMAETFDHPVYDCFYLALAEAETDILITANVRLLSRIRDRALRKRVHVLTSAG